MLTREKFIQSVLGTNVHVVVDRPIGYCHNGTVYSVNYGYIPGIMAPDGEEQDAYILGVSEPIAEFDGQVIGAVMRKDDCEDKLVVAPEGMRFHQGQIMDAVRFQEQYFDSYIVSLLRKSCGVLPYREQNGEREYLIVFEHYSKCWSLPKGHMEAGETEMQTALRELFEETGLRAVLDPENTATIEYPISPVARKQVLFFTGEVNGTLQLRNGEIDGFKWIHAKEFEDYLFPDTAAACAKLL